jgi:hypothetical protein
MRWTSICMAFVGLRYGSSEVGTYERRAKTIVLEPPASTRGTTRGARAVAAAARLVILACSATPAALAAQTIPVWVHDAFSSKTVHASESQRAIALLDDGCLDLRVIQQHGLPALLLLQPGTVLLKNEQQVDPADSAFQQLTKFDDEELDALALAVGADERPIRTAKQVPLVPGRPCFVRTIRRELGGGGALARVRCTSASAAGQPLAVELQLDVLPLDPKESLLPRRADGWYEQDVGVRDRVIELFPMEQFGHPSLGSLDVLRFDRDHLEWGGVLPREPIVLPGRLTASGLGFERILDAKDAKVGRNPFLWAFHDVKADELGLAKAFPITVVDPGGEPVHGAWVAARRSQARAQPAASLFSIQTDADGHVALPVEASDDPASVEIVAFEAGARARFGTRRGAALAAGGGGECVVVLDHDDAMELKVTPSPGRSCLAGVRVGTGSFLVTLDSEGKVRLPALAPSAVISLGVPYVERSTSIPLTAGSTQSIDAPISAGRERRLRFIDPRDGTAVRGFVVAPSSEGSAAWATLEDGVIVPAEHSAQPLVLEITAPGFRNKRLELDAAAPRDQDVLLEPK